MKFSKIESFLKKDKNKPKKVEEVFANDYIKIVKYEDWDIVTGKDSVVCIPYLVELNQFIIRKEPVPSFKYKDGNEYHLSCVGGTIENGEDPITALLREVQEEAGLVIREDYKIEMDKPLFLGKWTSIKVNTCILPLTERDYHEIIIKGDGSKIENMSTTAKVDVKYLNSLNPSDIVTEFMLDKLKKYIGI